MLAHSQQPSTGLVRCTLNVCLAVRSLPRLDGAPVGLNPLWRLIGQERIPPTPGVRRGRAVLPGVRANRSWAPHRRLAVSRRAAPNTHRRWRRSCARPRVRAYTVALGVPFRPPSKAARRPSRSSSSRTLRVLLDDPQDEVRELRDDRGDAGGHLPGLHLPDQSRVALPVAWGVLAPGSALVDRRSCLLRIASGPRVVSCAVYLVQ